MYEQKMTAHHAENHHYESPAIEANDALLITEVKTAIANSNLNQPYAVTVDADHGIVILTGEVPNPGMAGRLEQIASGCDGVKGCKAILTGRRRPIKRREPPNQPMGIQQTGEGRASLQIWAAATAPYAHRQAAEILRASYCGGWRLKANWSFAQHARAGIAKAKAEGVATYDMRTTVQKL
jgi:hypothetical protein